MKYIQSLLFLLTFPGYWAQAPDTIYTDEARVEIKMEISYTNCYFISIDTLYQVDLNAHENPNQVLLDRKSKKVLLERKLSNDTLYTYTYYASGKIKSIDIANHNNWYHHSTYYANGQLKSGGAIYADSLYPWNCYYPDGKIRSKGYRYSYLDLFGEYESYHPNGQLAEKISYSLPDTKASHYQKSTLLEAAYFDLNGHKTDSSQLDYQVMTIHLQPEIPFINIEQIGQWYTHYKVATQEGYNKQLQALKAAISEQYKMVHSCSCSQGMAWIGFVVQRNGKIGKIEVEFPDECVRKELEKAIGKLKNWTPGKVQDKTVDIYVYTYLPIY